LSSSYIVRRLLLVIPTLLGAAVLIFFLLRIIPGDVVQVKMMSDGGSASPDMVQRERVRLGLDKPIVIQFADWIKGLVTLDLGTSMWTGRPVIEEIGTRLELSVEVAVMAIVIGTSLAIPLGMLAAVFRNTILDYGIRVLVISGMAAPPFWVGMLIIIALLHYFNWLPPLTFTPIYRDPVANMSQLIWPAFAVSLRFIAVLARLVRASLIDVLSENYIRTARAKGLSERVVVCHHALRNALLPSLTFVGTEFAVLLGGIVVTEQVFNLNGLGHLLMEAVTRDDFILVQGIVMMLALVFVMLNLAVDLLYGVLDPRIRYT
jgi:peptide/nickel transport system permease protein